MRKLALSLIALGLILSLGMAPNRKEYSADRFDTHIVIQPDGSLLVTQTIVFRFVGGPFTYAFSDLITDYTDGVTDITASMDGQVLPRGRSAGQVELEGSRPIRVTWHFAPTSDATHTFVVTYHALGVVRQMSKADILYWQAISNKHDYEISSSTLKVTYPGKAVLIGSQIEQGQAQIEIGDSQVTFTTRNVGKNSPVQVSLRFEPGTVITAPPQWQVRDARAIRAAPVFVVIALALLALGVIGLAVVWVRNRRETLPTLASTSRPTAPPSDLPPAIAGVLNGSGAQPAWTNALATLFDLARRGVISIEESAKRGWFGSRDFVIHSNSQPDDLRPHERGLLEILFTTKTGTRSSVKLSELSSQLESRWKKFSEPLKQELQTGGFLDPQRQQVKRRFTVFGIILCAAGPLAIAASLILLWNWGGWPILIGLSLILIGVVALVMGAVFSPLSDAGVQEAERWQGFYEYLRDVTRGREPVLRPDVFEAYLPYAASYGLAEAWAKFFQKQGTAQIPAWFRALASSGASDEGMGAFVAMTGSAGSVGSSSGASAGGAAGAGASGAG